MSLVLKFQLTFVDVPDSGNNPFTIDELCQPWIDSGTSTIADPYRSLSGSVKNLRVLWVVGVLATVAAFIIKLLANRCDSPLPNKVQGVCHSVPLETHHLACSRLSNALQNIQNTFEYHLEVWGKELV